jgi:hypothetical protein
LDARSVLREEDASYEYLLGVSGLAFRMQVSREGLCPSSPHSFCGYPCHARSSRALPWKLKIFEVQPDDAGGVRKARQAIVGSIDRGVPAQYGSEEDGIIVGYQKGGEEWICSGAWKPPCRSNARPSGSSKQPSPQKRLLRHNARPGNAEKAHDHL